jgi:hypothetical protein
VTRAVQKPDLAENPENWKRPANTFVRWNRSCARRDAGSRPWNVARNENRAAHAVARIRLPRLRPSPLLHCIGPLRSKNPTHDPRQAPDQDLRHLPKGGKDVESKAWE